MDAIETIQLTDGSTAKIYQDECTINDPRGWDNLGTMICFHKHYSLGDKHNLKTDSFDGWDAIRQYLIDEEQAEIILPLYLYDHSGITMATHPFSCHWDSGQVGFIFVTEKKRKAEGLTKKQAEQQLQAEVKTYNQYLTGDVYSYKVTKEEYCSHCGVTTFKTLDSCGGYYGHDFKENGLYDAINAMSPRKSV